MRYIIGAGAGGGTIGGRLFESGHDVVLVPRGQHHLAIRDKGLLLGSPEDSVALPVPVIAGSEEIELREDDVVVSAVKSQDTRACSGTGPMSRWAHQAGPGAARVGCLAPGLFTKAAFPGIPCRPPPAGCGSAGADVKHMKVGGQINGVGVAPDTEVGEPDIPECELCRRQGGAQAAEEFIVGSC